MNENQKLIFISYAKPDQERVALFVDALEKHGYQVWVDFKRLKGGQNWDLEIRRALSDAAIVVVFLSSHSVNRRGYAQREVKIALDQAQEKLIDDIYIIPVMLDDLPIIPDLVRRIQVINGWKIEAEAQIVDSIAHQLQSTQSEPPLMVDDVSITWMDEVCNERWEGLPGYDIEYSTPRFGSDLKDITAIVRGEIVQLAASERKVKFSQDTKSYHFGMSKYQRTNEFLARCGRPISVGRMLSLVYPINTYNAGAAHGHHSFKIFNFITDPIIRVESISDLFLDINTAFPVLQAKVRTALTQHLTEGDEEKWIDENFLVDGTASIADFENFAFCNDGIVLYFSSYQVACFAAGTPIVSISNKDICRMMWPQYVSLLGWEHLQW